MNSFTAVVAVFLALIATDTNAEGGCPPGQIPYSGTPVPGSTASMATCGPIPTSQPAAPQWRSRWGAIADDRYGVFGIVADERSERSAKKAAVAACIDRGGKDCKATFTYRDQCAVVVGTDTNSISQGAATIEQAKSLALEKCEAAGSKECWVYYSGCSLPVRVR